MEEFVQYVKATLLKLIGLTCIGMALLGITGYTQYITGWCAGSGLNIIYFLMLSNRSARAIKLPPGRVVSFIRGGAVLRLTLICLASILILQFPSIHFGAAAVGFFTYRFVIFADFAAKRLSNR